MRFLLLTLCVLFGIAAFSPAFAQRRPVEARLENLDLRTDRPPAKRETSSAITELRQRVPAVTVDMDGITGAAGFIRAGQGYLTGRGGVGGAVPAAAYAGLAVDDPYRGTKAFLNEHRALFGHGAEILVGSKLQREFANPQSGAKTFIWQQHVNDIPVFEALLISHETRNAEIISISHQFVPDPGGAADAANRAGLAVAPIPASGAIVRAAGAIDETLTEADIRTLIVPEGVDKKQSFAANGLPGQIHARLVWLPVGSNRLQLCWDILLKGRVHSELFRVLIDAHTGEIWLRRSLTAYSTPASYRVWVSDSPSPFSPGPATRSSQQPPLVPRVLVVTNAANTNASPLGWINDGDNETRGNNVDAHLDADADDEPDLPRPQGAPMRVFDFPIDLEQAPETYSAGAVVQLFYWCNWMHDQLYDLGFTEAAGNFQADNFGRGGSGSDPLQADAQDGSGFNNANMDTPPDGLSPRMQMFIFNGPAPNRDCDFDAEVILHEYTHGLSNRRVGGGVGLSTLQSQGMGEGWSDFYALTLLSQAADEVDGVYAMGGYSTYRLDGLLENYYFGIRRYPYCTDLGKNPLTFKDIDPGQALAHTNSPLSPIYSPFSAYSANEVHSQGELWCVTLWGARANLIKKHGFAMGNRLILQLVTDGMNLAPPNPNFLQARDAILLADQVNNNGANQKELWTAFARRGMGFSASSPASTTTAGVRESFDEPDDLRVLQITDWLPRGPVGGPFVPSSQTYTLTNLSTNIVIWTASRSAGWLKVMPVSGVMAPAGPSMTLTLSLENAALSLPPGVYADTVVISNATTHAVQFRRVTLAVGFGDSFTQWFENGDNDLSFKSFTFTPDGSESFYSVCRQSTLNFPTDPTGGTPLSLSFGSYTQITTTASVSLYGRSTNVLFVGSSGYVTFDAGDTSFFESFTGHFSYRRIAALYSTLYPGIANAISWKQLADRVAISYVNIYDLFNNLPNSFQIELFFDGRIRLTYLDIGTTNGLVGLSRGEGLPPGFEESDFTSYQACGQPIVLTLPVEITESAGFLPGRGFVQLTGITSSNRVVTLTCSDTTELVLPATVIVPAGQREAAFDITAPDDPDLDGTQIVTVTASAAGHQTALVHVRVIDEETTSLSLNMPASTAEGVGVVTGRVSMSVSSPVGIAVSLSSSDTNELVVPAIVIIPAGATFADFTATVVDDLRLDGSQNVTVTAHVANWSDATSSIVIADNDPTTLTVSLPFTTREGSGTLTNAGFVRLAGILPTNLVVHLASSDTTEITVPSSVIVSAGTFFSRFNISVQDDPDVDGTQRVAVTATAAGFTDGTAMLDVLDDETPLPPAFPTPPDLAGNISVMTNLSWSGGAYTELLINGDFETGDFTGWLLAASGTNSFEINAATNDPPFAGRFSALFGGPSGDYELFRDVVLPVGASHITLNWADRVRSSYEVFTEYQQYRVELRTLNGTLLAVAHATMPGDVVLDAWGTHSFDLTPLAGQTLRMSFIIHSIVSGLQVQVDNVSVEIPASATYDIYFGTDPKLGAGQWLGVTTNGTWPLPVLAPGTTYYWQIVAHTLGSISGPVWQFTTRGVDRFEWSPLASPQIAGQPFNARLTAKDPFGTTVSNFNGEVQLEALGMPVPVTRLNDGFEDGDFNGWIAGSGPFERSVTSATAAEGQRSLTLLGGAAEHRTGISHSLPNLTPDEVRFSIRASRNDASAGYVTLGVGTNLADIAVYFYLSGDGRMNLVEASGSYHSVPYEANRWYDIRFRFDWAQKTVDFYVDGVLIERAVPFRGIYASWLSGIWLYNFEFAQCWWDNFQVLTDGSPRHFPVMPTRIAGFTNGVWSGSLTLTDPAERILLRATDEQGHFGESNPLNVVQTNDLSVDVSGSPDPATIFSEIVYDVSVFNSGPSTAAAVILTNFLPAGSSLRWFAESQGHCTQSNDQIICEFGALTNNSTARLTVAVAPGHFGLFTNGAVVSRGDLDAVPTNNSASAVILVAPPFLTVSDAVVTEGNTGKSRMDFQLTLSASNAFPVTVTFLTTNGSATAGSDYVPASGTIVFPPGSTQQTVTVLINGDVTNEVDETFDLLLIGAVNASILKYRAVGVIINDDQPAVASMPFVEDWETGSFRPFWLVTGTAGARSQVSATNGPHAGRFHLTMDNGVNDYVDKRNEVTLFVDMQGWTNVQLRFWALEIYEYADGPPPSPFYGGADFDGVAVSMDGVQWFEAQGLRTLVSTGYTEIHVDLDSVLREHGLAYTSTFRVRFNEFGPFSLPYGGLAIDDISITGRAGGITPAGTELLTETCANGNGAIDPGETVTVSFALTNADFQPTAHLTATLLADGGVLAPSAPQDYGVLNRGSIAARPFTFLAGGVCGGTVRATLRLQDGATDLGRAIFSLPLGGSITNVVVFRDVNPMTIPTSGNAAPYPTSNLVSGVVGTVQKVTVTLYGYSHTAPDHVDALLVGPLGQAVEIFSDCGGSNAISGITLTIDSTAATRLPDDAQIVSGTYAPGNYGSSDAFPSPAPPGPWGMDLAAFNGLNPNGVWRLFLVDDTFPEEGEVESGWSIAFETRTTTCCANTNQVDLTLRIGDSPDPVNVNGNLTYTYFITNLGPATATGVVLTNTLPPGVSFVSAQGLCTHSNGIIRCTPAMIRSNFTAVAFVTVKPLVPGLITNVAGVTCNETDRNGANNTTAAVTSVAPPSILLQSLTLSEAPTNSYALVSVRLSSPSSNIISVQFQTADVTAQAGLDYAATNGVLVFPPGETNLILPVLILADTLNEATETFALNFYNPANAILNSPTVICSILDDDPLPSFSIDDVTVTEGNSGFTPATFHVRLSPPSGQYVQVNFATIIGTASSASDYVATNGSLLFTRGATNRTVTVLIRGDTTNESDETFGLNLSAPVGATVLVEEGLGIILNDDLLPTLVVTGTSLIAESCSPTNGVVDPDETVTVSFTLRNVSSGGAAATNLVVTLLPGGGINAPGAPQVYGNLPPSTQATRAFAFTADGNCGGTIRAVLSLQAGPVFLGTITNIMTLGRSVIALTQSFDLVTSPSLPAGWAASATASTPWRTVTSLRDTSPNSVFAANPSTTSANELTSPPIHIATPEARLSFRHYFDTESGFDGGTLLYSTNGIAYTNIIAAGGRFITGGYNGTVDFDTPAWSGRSTNWVNVVVALPANAVDKNVRFRWRMTSDGSVGADGWYVDSISIFDGFICCAPPPLKLSSIRIDTGIVTLQWVSIPGQVYRVQFKSALDEPQWMNLPGDVTAAGPTAAKNDMAGPVSPRFYRVIQLP